MTLLIPLAAPSAAQEAHPDSKSDATAAPLLEPQLSLFVRETAESVNKWLEEASQYQNAQDYAEALKLFDLILENDPDNIAAICGRVNCLRLTHKFSEAKLEAENAIERDLASRRLYVGLGWLLHGEGDYATALKWYDKADADAEQHGNIEIGIARSNTLCAQGNAGAACDLIDELLKLNEENFALLEERAWIAFSRRDYGDAESTFRELYAKAQLTLRSNGDNVSAAEMARMSYGLGYVAMKQGDNFGALTHFSDAREKFDTPVLQLPFSGL